MKIAVISDIHGNLAALEAFFEACEHDELFFVGDLVGYGPNPAEAVRRLMGEPEAEVQGDHDFSFAENLPLTMNEPYATMAAETIEWTRGQVMGELWQYLKYLPRRSFYEADGRTFAIGHASVGVDLAEALSGDAPEEELIEKLADLDADTIIVSHTHVPYIRQIGQKLLVNPGSIGLPRDGVPEISYILFDSGAPVLLRTPYDIERTVTDLDKMEVSADVKEKLAHVLRTATDPA